MLVSCRSVGAWECRGRQISKKVLLSVLNTLPVMNVANTSGIMCLARRESSEGAMRYQHSPQGLCCLQIPKCQRSEGPTGRLVPLIYLSTLHEGSVVNKNVSPLDWKSTNLAGPSDLFSTGEQSHSPCGLCRYLAAPLELGNSVAGRSFEWFSCLY